MKQRGRPKHPDILTPREWEVLGLVREGLSNDAIGERLGISLDGVKFHVSEILGRLGVSDRQEAANWQPGGRPWWMAAVTPFLFWRKLGFGWVAPAVTGGVAVTVVAGAGLLIWGLSRTQAGTESASAGEYALAQTFLNPDPGDSHLIVFSVAAAGDNVLVGVPDDDTGAAGAGIAYLFDGGDGALLQTFLNPDPDENDEFGSSVASVGDDVLIGARSAGVGGAAYLFDGGSGELLQTFLNPKQDCGYSFGAAVAGVEGNVLVGARGHSTAAGTLVCASGVEASSDGGAAYLFDGATGALLQTFVSPEPSGARNFGASVADVGGNVLVGARKEVPLTGLGGPASVDDDVLSGPAGVGDSFFAETVRDDALVPDTGAAYLFDAESGALLQTFVNPTPSSGGFFGDTVDGVGGNVLVSARIDPGMASGEGAVYLFDSESGALLHTFTSPKVDQRDSFGRSLAGVGGNVLVSAPYDGTEGEAGAVYLFDGESGALLWTFINPTVPDQPGVVDFGWSLAAAGERIVVGARGGNAGTYRSSGVAYLFAVHDPEDDVVAPTAVTFEEDPAIREAGEDLCLFFEIDRLEACANQYVSAVRRGVPAVLCVNDEDGTSYFGTVGGPLELEGAVEASEVGDDCGSPGYIAVALMDGSEP